MAEFTKKWDPPYKPNRSDKVSDAFHNQGPLKPRLGEGTSLLATQKAKLEGIISKMEYQDKKLLKDVAAAKQSGDMYKARTLASELAQSRAAQQMIVRVRTLIDRTESRFMAYDGIGDVAVTLEPIILLMENLKSSLGEFFPNAVSSITQMIDTPDNYIPQTQNQVEFNTNTNSMNADVENIMSEAAAVASDSVNDRLPSTPIELDHTTTSNNTI